MTFSRFSWLFCLLAVLHGSWIQTLNFVLFIIDGLIKGEIEKPSGQFLGLIVMSHWLAELWIWIRDSFSGFYLIFVSFGEPRLLVLWCAGGRCGMVGSDEDHDRSRRSSVEDWGWSHMSDTRWPDDRDVGWCYVWSTLWTMRWGAQISWLSLKTKVDGLSVVWPQNHYDGLSAVWRQNHWDSFLRFDLKTNDDGFLRFGHKTSGDNFSRFSLKTGGLGFLFWTSKPVAMVWWFGPQNHHDGFLICVSKPSGLRFVICATKPMEGGVARDTRRDIAASFAWKQVDLGFPSLA
jgi:hypothetical protein